MLKISINYYPPKKYIHNLNANGEFLKGPNFKNSIYCDFPIEEISPSNDSYYNEFYGSCHGA